jgi:hypothetical protein
MGRVTGCAKDVDEVAFARVGWNVMFYFMR